MRITPGRCAGRLFPTTVRLLTRYLLAIPVCAGLGEADPALVQLPTVLHCDQYLATVQQLEQLQLQWQRCDLLR